MDFHSSEKKGAHWQQLLVAQQGLPAQQPSVQAPGAQGHGGGAQQPPVSEPQVVPHASASHLHESQHEVSQHGPHLHFAGMSVCWWFARVGGLSGRQ